VLVLLVAFLSYLPNLSGFGYYQDDWYLLWSARARGPESIITLFSMDRPFMGFVNYVDYLLLGENLTMWRGMAFFWRVLNSLGVLWLLRLVWPEKKFITTAAALLVTVYPAYLTQPIVLNFKNYIFEYTLAIFSMITMIYALRTDRLVKKILLNGLALSLTLFYVLLYEFMIGLEGTRLALIAYLVWQERDWVRRIKSYLARCIRVVLPYAAISLGFITWRFFIFASERPSVSEAAVLAKYLNSPLVAGRNTLIELGKDVIETLLLSWAVPFYRFAVSSAYRDLGGAVLVSGIAVLLVMWYGIRLKSQENQEISNGMGIFFMIGGVSLLASLLTIVIPGRNILLAHAFGRYSLHATLGIGLLVAGFINSLPEKSKWFSLVVLIGLSVSTQYLNGLDWQRQWATLQNTWWQITWRAPQIQEDTLILHSETYGPQQDYEVWGPANLIYYPNDDNPSLDAEVLYSGSVDLLFRGRTDSDRLRDISLSKEYSNALIFSKPSSNSCIHAIDGTFPILPSGENSYVRLGAQFSDINRIMADNPTPVVPSTIFGPEPEHNWCYYFQRASLARQQGDWAEVVRLGNEANNLGLSAVDPSEWLVFLEANMIEGRYSQARWMSKIIKSDRMLVTSICQNLDTGAPTPRGYDYEGVYGLLCEK
jgi:hypothetical protein